MPVGRFSICVNRPSQVGVTGKCITQFNWAKIISCPIAVTGGFTACAAAYASGGGMTQQCAWALATVVNTCGGCGNAVSCISARQEPKYAQEYYYSQAGGDCSGGIYTCDPEFFPSR